MAKNIVHEECARVTVVAGGTVTAGTPYAVGSLFGIPIHSAASGESVTLVVNGRVTVPKATGAGTDHALGDPLEWDGSGGTVIDLANARQVGICVKAATTTDATVDILLTPGAVDATA